MTGADIALCTSDGLWLTPQPAAEGNANAAERPMTAICNAKATAEFKRMRAAGDEIAVAKAKAVGAAETAVRSQLRMLFQRCFLQLTSSGIECNTAAVQALRIRHV